MCPDFKIACVFYQNYFLSLLHSKEVTNMGISRKLLEKILSVRVLGAFFKLHSLYIYLPSLPGAKADPDQYSVPIYE